MKLEKEGGKEGRLTLFLLDQHLASTPHHQEALPRVVSHLLQVLHQGSNKDRDRDSTASKVSLASLREVMGDITNNLQANLVKAVTVNSNNLARANMDSSKDRVAKANMDNSSNPKVACQTSNMASSPHNTNHLPELQVLPVPVVVVVETLRTQASFSPSCNNVSKTYVTVHNLRGVRSLTSV